MTSWDGVAAELQTRLTAQAFDIWIRPLRLVSDDGSVLTLSAPDAFHCRWVGENYRTELAAAIAAAAPGRRVEFVVRSVTLAENEVALKPKVSVAEGTSVTEDATPTFHPQLDKRYTFENFVVGPSNQVAHASAEAVAASPGATFNPLFIAGGAGLGKTHILHAIGHRIYQRFPRYRILCLSAERFMYEYVHSIRNGQSIEFKERFGQSCDVLLVDDVHTLAGREGTQEEFFHVFNRLHDLRKQMVFTSDKYPRDMSGLEERLRSRFEWGLIADVQPPNTETRLAIIGRKAELLEITLPPDVALYLASLPLTSVRDLEGCMNRLLAYSQFEKQPITLAAAQRWLASHMGERRAVTVDDILRRVCDFYDVRIPDLKSASRKASLTLPRHVAMYLCREVMKLSYPEIGSRFGGRNHTSVMHACESVRTKMQSDSRFAETVNALMRSLG